MRTCSLRTKRSGHVLSVRELVLLAPHQGGCDRTATRSTLALRAYTLRHERADMLMQLASRLVHGTCCAGPFIVVRRAQGLATNSPSDALSDAKIRHILAHRPEALPQPKETRARRQNRAKTKDAASRHGIGTLGRYPLGYYQFCTQQGTSSQFASWCCSLSTKGAAIALRSDRL